MKICINRRPIRGPWGGGAQFINSFHKLVPDMGHEMVPPDSMSVAPEAILLAGLENDNQGGISAEQAVMYKMYMKPDCKLVLRVNENDARKGTSHVDDLLMQVFPHMDGVVFVSHWLRDYFRDVGWEGPNDTVIVNGVDAEIFNRQPLIDNNKINIVAHHWSDNVLKGFDIYEKIDEFVGQNSLEYQFTYIGRDRQTFKNTNVVRPLSGKRLGEELGKHDVYVSASRFDPGPNHITEAISCGLPTYVHEKGGGAVEFAGADHAYSDWEALQALLLEAKFTKNSTQFGSWKDCIEQYVQFITTL